MEQSRRGESRWELITCGAGEACEGSAHDETVCCVGENVIRCPGPALALAGFPPQSANQLRPPPTFALCI